MKNTIRNTVNEIYNTNVNNIKSDPLLSAKQLMSNIPNITNNSNVTLRQKIPLRQNNDNSILLFLLIFILISFFGLVLHFRDKIKLYLNKYFKLSPEESEKKDEEAKEEKDEEAKEKKDEEAKEEKDEEPVKVNKKLEKNINKDNYPKEQIVKEDDMYCYLGKDDDMRQCIQVFKNDICTSGDIFNRIDQCLVPNKENI